MIFEIKEKKDKELEEMYEKAMKELDEFFELDWKIKTPKIIIINDRKKIDAWKNEKTPNWVVGWAEGRAIYLLDKKNFEKESSHKYSKEKYFKLIKHELCHLFFGISSKSHNPNQFSWFNEGLAGYLSEQYKDKTKPEKLSRFLSQYSKWDGKSYQESAYAIKLVYKKFGKQKLLTLIKSLKKVKSEEDFNKLFKEIYDSELTYEFFNKLLKQENENKKTN